MLDFIRRKQKSVLVQIVFWGIIATFVGTIFLVWGQGQDSSSRSTEEHVVKVNKTPIAISQFQSAYANLYRMYQNLYREAFTPAVEQKLNLRKMALDSLIDQTLLVQEAKQRNVSVSDKELVESIAKIEAFQESGAFNRARYVQVLRGQRLSPDEFEEMQRRQLLVEKVRAAIEQEATATDAEIEQEYKDVNEKVELAMIRLQPENYAAKVVVDGAGLQTYFAAHKDEFRLPDMVNLQYVVVDPRKFMENLQIADAELQTYYQRNLDKFEIPEQVRAAHILIRVPQGATAAVKAEKRAQAEKVLAQVKGGSDFATIARQFSEDPGSAAQGGELGFFGRGTMVAPFENAAFALSTGGVSELVETDFGYHIIRVNEHRDAAIKKFDEVAAEVKAGAREEKARQLALEKAMDLYNLNRKGGTLQAAAASVGADIRETGFFSKDQPQVPALSLPQDLVETAFTLAAGELGKPVGLPQGALLFALKEKRASHVPELSEVRAAAETAYRKERAKDLARGEGQLILAELRGGGSIETVAAKRSLKVETTGLFARSRNHFVPLAGSSEELSKAAFELTAAAPVPGKVFDLDGNQLVVRLAQRQTAAPAGLTTAVRDELRKAVIERKKGEVLEKTLKGLRDKATLEYAPAFVEYQGGKAL